MIDVYHPCTYLCEKTTWTKPEGNSVSIIHHAFKNHRLSPPRTLVRLMMLDRPSVSFRPTKPTQCIFNAWHAQAVIIISHPFLDLINIDILVITAVVSILVEFDVVIHTLVTVSITPTVSLHLPKTPPHPKPHTKSRNYTYVSVSLIFAVSGSSPYAFKLLASSALYFNITSPFSS